MHYVIGRKRDGVSEFLSWIVDREGRRSFLQFKTLDRAIAYATEAEAKKDIQECEGTVGCVVLRVDARYPS